MSAQPRVGVIDFYGLQHVTEAQVRAELGVREGDPLPRSKGDTEGRLDQIPGVVESHLEAVCCDDGKMILYVGIEERGAHHFETRDPPDTDADLPVEVTNAYKRFLAASELASRYGQNKEDLTQGHALSQNPEEREVQQEFPAIVTRYIGDLRHTLHDSSDEEQRAIAVYVLAYARQKLDIINDLQYALKDDDPGVRLNAVHALKALAVYAQLHPEAGVKIEPTWLIEMLNSLSWQDRTEALDVLSILAAKADPDTLQEIRDRGLEALVEMARWKTLAHALPAYLMLGKIAGMPDAEVQAAWTRGDRESVIQMAMGPKKRK
ncbi:MAG TPA: HEAT repeat domain-containing protein [Bryobacteraceae bacterium]|nr:HEAT repeat domain-containing protein [Bryobacteraceae bacterium]